MTAPRRAPRWLVPLGAVAALFCPALARACPVCANGRDGGLGALALLAAMVGAPYLIGAVALRALRRIDHETRPDAPPACPTPARGGDA